MRKIFYLMLLVLALGVKAQEAQVMVNVVYTNAQDKVVVRAVELQGWSAKFDGTNWTAVVGQATVGTNGLHADGKIVADEVDIESTDPYHGLIMTATNGATFVMGVATNGDIFTVQDSASPQIPHNERVAKMKGEQKGIVDTKKNWKPNGQIQKRLEQVEKLLGLRPLDP